MIMQKRLFSVLMAIVMVFSILPTFVFAETGDTFAVETIEEWYVDEDTEGTFILYTTYNVLTEDASGGTVEVSKIGFDITMSEDKKFGFQLPDTVENDGKTYTVTEIGDSAFEGCTSLMYVILPNSLTKIGSRAFKGCSRLHFIDIPISVTDIGDSAFMSCSNLYDVISGSKTPAKLGKDVFANCSPRFQIVIPNGTSEEYAAKGWPEDCLEEFSLFEGKILDTYSNPIEGATVSVYDENEILKGKVITDEYGLFDVTDYVEYDVEQTAKIEKFGYMTMDINFAPMQTGGVKDTYYTIALAKSYGGFSANTIEGAPITYQILTKDETNKIGTVRVVYGPGSLYDGSITLPNTVTYDGITYTVTEIGDNAFSDHYNLTSIVLPSSLENIGDLAFSQCSSLEIISNNQIPAQANDSMLVGSIDSYIYIPAGTKQDYIDAGWPEWKLIEIGFYSLSGKVVDENGNGIADVLVAISSVGGYKESMRTDSDGNYNFKNCIGNQLYTIKAKKDGYKQLIKKIRLDESDVTDFDIIMSLVSNVPGDVPGDGNLPDSPTPTPSSPTPTPTTPSTPTSNNPSIPSNNSVTPTNNPQTSINNTPQTGDNSGTIIYIAFGCMLMAILVAGCLVVAKRRKNEI